MKQKEQKQSVYEKVIGFLRKPIFRTFANVFSHGGTHLAFFAIIFGAIAYYLFYVNNKKTISPHNIGIDIGYPSYSQGAALSTSDSIKRDVVIKIRLNSDSIANKTNNVYHNGIITEFYRENKIYERTLVVGEKMINVSDTFMIVSVYIEPAIKDSDAKLDTIYETSDTTWIGSIPIKTDTSPNCISTFIPPIDAKCNVSFFSDEFGVESNNPYYYYYISIPSQKFVDGLSVELSTTDEKKKGLLGLYSNNDKSLQYTYVFPEPDLIGNGKIIYTSKEKKESIGRNKGIVIQAVDINVLNSQNRKAFLYSVLVGTGFAFLLDIIIQLIRELKRLQRRKEA